MTNIKIKLLGMLLLFFLVLPIFAASDILLSASAGCLNEKKLKAIAREIETSFEKNICANGIKPMQLQWLSTTALPQLMNKSFLGVEPPPNWQLLTEELMRDCFKEGNLCTETTQKQVVACLQIKAPTVLLQLGPWLAENCKAINNEVIEKWPDKKQKVLELIKEFQVQSTQ
ncbi:hypothetical protein [Legionella clemsonensis]|uniref:Uncharacterized protein n=1 Tax=Legionella clemsonensis TaxID=1867846 RepID=A0A222P418_9GAMM|nr:hypothetical protein [Legionella clemsonensis]ASQ46579.1 hypothetical protein clem_10150 [Legionella clemsonensis]